MIANNDGPVAPGNRPRPGNPRRREAGFTLAELLVVVVILALLAGIVMAKVMGRVGQAQVATTRTQIKELDTALELFYFDNNRYPTQDEGLAALVTRPGGADLPKYPEGGYMKQHAVPKDGWSHEFIYHEPGSEGRDYEITSYGKDGNPGGGDDLNSWETGTEAENQKKP